MQLFGHLADLGWPVDIVALHAGADTVALDVDVLGRRRLSLGTLWALRRRARAADIVVAYGSATLPACAIALFGRSAPILYRSISDPAHWLRGPLHRAVTRLQYRRAAAVVALWPGAVDRLVDQLGVDRERIVVIPNARDPEQFRPPTAAERAAARERFGLGPGRVVAFVGAASPEKRLDVAIDTVARLPDHVLLVAGGGAGLVEARRQADEQLGERAVFLGEIDDVRPVLHASDVVLITSDVEGMPGVAIEAALCGVPVVAPAVGAIESMGWVHVCPAVADALAVTVRNAACAQQPQAAADFTWTTVVPRGAQWIDLLDRT